MVDMQPFSDFFSANYRALEIATAFVAVVVLISSIDDLFIDARYWIREIWRHLRVKPLHTALTPAQLRSVPEKPIAIMVPAWQEHDVIASMIENMVATLEYREFMVFVGTYPNDQRTIDEVERMRRRYKQLVRVQVPHDGPTCKADCLNSIVQSIEQTAQKRGIEFAGMVLHDSEDVLHPLELKYFNYLLPRIDFIQLPVTSLERNWNEWVAGVYMDEFAEWHAKDLVVRESMSGMVPSAGVGTCFSRKAMLALMAETEGQPFNPDTLTEDYDVGTRLARMGMRQIFGKFPVQYRVKRKDWTGKEKQIEITMPLGVREFFPNTFRTAYRQKARWTLGIGLQGWEQVGWQGNAAVKYLLFRDRKGLITAFVAIAAYLIFFNYMLLALLGAMGWWSDSLPPIQSLAHWVQVVIALNFMALLLRMAQRAYFVGRIYGGVHALLSIPRMVVGNFINAAAAGRAWKQYLSHKLFGSKLVWDKTMHDFPTVEQLAEQKQHLGDLLKSWQAIDGETLDAALEQQAQTGGTLLGQVLLQNGWVDEDLLAEARAYQADLPRLHLADGEERIDLSLLPARDMIRWRMLPLASSDESALHVAVASVLPEPVQAQLQARLKRPLRQLVVRESDIAAGLRQLSGMAEEEGGASAALLGDCLIYRGDLSREALDQVLDSYDAARDGRLGGHLVHQGLVTPEQLDKALLEQQKARRKPSEEEGE
ncbi:MAG: glycosyl transferase family protein [Comamonas sp.]